MSPVCHHKNLCLLSRIGRLLHRGWGIRAMAAGGPACGSLATTANPMLTAAKPAALLGQEEGPLVSSRRKSGSLQGRCQANQQVGP